jgi:TolB-like protein/Tfp pilus assembly protein PilF
MIEPAAGSDDVVSFGPFSLDPRRRLLLKDGAPVAVGARTLDTLMALVARPNESISKRELMAAVWPDVTVEEGSLRAQIAALRKALGDGKGDARYITTLAGRGYCFVAPISRVRDRGGERAAATKPALALPDKPSIAVLAFQNMSGDPEQEYFADGMVEEIITALSRIRWLFVIARNSSFTYKGQAVDVKQVGRELGVRYVLEGSVRKAGGRVRITPQLIDAISGAHIWADRFDGSLEDVFELQDKVASSVAGAIEPALQAVETARSASRPTNDLTAYDLYLRAWHNVLSYDKGRIDQALDLLEEATARDPGYGAALALAAYCYQQLQISGWAEDREANRRTAIDLARRAVQVATDDPIALGQAALVLGYFGEDIDAALALIDRALALNPSSARAWYWSGYLRLYSGRPGLAIEHFNSSLRLSPRDPTRGRSLTGIGIAEFFNERYEQAAATLLGSLQEFPTYAPTYRFLASCYAHMGRLDEAREIVERLRAFTTGVLESFSYIRNPRHRELFLSGLRLAMGETT